MSIEIIGFAAGPLQTNCYLVTGVAADPEAGAGAPGRPCLVIDPGMGAAARVRELCAEHGLAPEAVLLTHGHIDHTRDSTEVQREHGAPVRINAHDRFMVANPVIGAGLNLGAMFDVAAMDPPEDPGDLPDGAELALAGLTVRVSHAPGHSPGSVMLRVADGAEEVLFTGDVLFAGSIGRTDLPASDPAAMLATLRERVLPLPDELPVLPGHGPGSTIGAERAGNPFLAQVR
ncbi:MBL fold metallo-hydrolase [Corynebacterium sphenisci]|uniref:MBL fold metallo-hydrolase n=1 Tax=Corynebacterium sphenisci TaxID=191493 RepID=UPI0034A06A0F